MIQTIKLRPAGVSGAQVRGGASPQLSADAFEQPLYEITQKVYPRAVHGWFAGWRWALAWIRARVRNLAAAALAATWATPVAGAEALEARLATCLACHGEKGQSVTPEVPSLGGQPAFYLSVQMLMFRDRLRVVDVMNQMMQGFSNDDLQKMAAIVSKLPPPQPAAGGDPARMERGRELAEQNRCNFCHDRDYSGDRNIPRLAGQREDYLVKALREYKNNTRRGYDASMADVLYSVGNDEILDSMRGIRSKGE